MGTPVRIACPLDAVVIPGAASDLSSVCAEEEDLMTMSACYE